MLGLEEALRWIQIGACITGGYYGIRVAGWLVLLIVDWVY